MLITITEYQRMARDADGNSIPLGSGRLQSQKVTAAGDVTILAHTKFVRISTDTAIHVKPNGTGADDGDELMHASTVEFFETTGTIIDIQAA